MGECSSWGNFVWKVLVLAVIWGDVPWGKLPCQVSGLFCILRFHG